MEAALMLSFWALTLPILPGVLGAEWAVTHQRSLFCAVRGATIFITCQYSYPSGQQVREAMWCHRCPHCSAASPVWHTSGTIAPQFRGRVEFVGDKEKNCSLKITDIRPEDAGVYRFQAITDKERFRDEHGVMVQFSELKVKMNSSVVSGAVREGTAVTLTCGAESCLLTPRSFVWFKDRKELEENQAMLHLTPVSLRDTGNYSCAFKHNKKTQTAQFSLNIQTEADITPVLLFFLPGILLVLLSGTLVTIICIRRRKEQPATEGHGGEGDAQRTSRDSNTDPYATLDVQNRQPDYASLVFSKLVKSTAKPTNTKVWTSTQSAEYENAEMKI